MGVTRSYERGHSGNVFLDSLRGEGRVHDALVFERAAQGTPVARAGADIDSIYFPASSVISNVVRMRDGSEVEALLVGRDGFFGMSIVLGVDESPVDAMFQIAGDAWRMPRIAFSACLAADAELRERCSRYTFFSIAAVSQFAGCNRLHPLNERLARWLLMAHDRVDGNGFMLTQEFLSTMLGVRRPGVSVAAATLDTAGLIEYKRGHITVRDRKGLESAACECYATTAALLEKMLGYRLEKRDLPA